MGDNRIEMLKNILNRIDKMSNEERYERYKELSNQLDNDEPLSDRDISIFEYGILFSKEAANVETKEIKEDFGPSNYLIKIIKIIGDEKQLRIKDLSRITNTTSQNISVFLSNNKQCRTYIDVTTSQTKKSSKVLRLTSEGEKIYQNLKNNKKTKRNSKPKQTDDQKFEHSF